MSTCGKCQNPACEQCFPKKTGLTEEIDSVNDRGHIIPNEVQEALGVRNLTRNKLNEHIFNIVTNEMLELYIRKNSDYGSAFDHSLDEDGLLVAKIRMGDKLRRFSSLIRSEQMVKDESIRDTLIDLANYAVMTIIWMDNKGSKRDDDGAI